MATPSSFARGSTISLRRSLRVRVIAATGLAFVGLGVLVCLILPRAYRQMARDHLRDRTEVLARGVAHTLQEEFRHSGEISIPALARWLDDEPDLEATVVLDERGTVIAGWPGSTAGWDHGLPRELTVLERPDHFLAIAPFASPAGEVAGIGVRTTTDRLRSELEGVLWLFASIFLLTCAGFVVLATYLSRAILDPLEEIRKAAMSLADGEPLVHVPVSGDLEIDELGSFIAALGAKRRQSTVMKNPLARRTHELEKKEAAPADRPAAPNQPEHR